MDDDIEPHACVTKTTKFVALARVVARLIRLNTQAVHMPGHGIDLAREAGIQNAWITSWLETRT